MDQFIAHLLIKQIEKDNKIASALNQKNTVKKEYQIKNNCFRCGQNSYWCQCDTIDNVGPQLPNPHT